MKFKHIAYYESMDFLLYLAEDCSYVTYYLNNKLDILYHPYKQEKIVGVRIFFYKNTFKKLSKKPKYLLTELLNIKHKKLITFANKVLLSRKEITP